VIDTFLGPNAISETKVFLNTVFANKPVIVINTHAHFDHFGGNCAFQDTLIVGHVLCKQDIIRKQQVEYLVKTASLQYGKVKLVESNLTFEKRMVFEDDGLELFHSPGHTRDGISIIDHEDQVLLVGDSIGLPNPSIYPGVKVQDYIETLEGYRLLGLPNVISSHYNQIEDALIAANIEYLQKLLHNDTAVYDQCKYQFFQ
jgi:glyoxylase-like metal-dependent hydrolase (beta-lactamase superfamily II)